MPQSALPLPASPANSPPELELLEELDDELDDEELLDELDDELLEDGVAPDDELLLDELEDELLEDGAAPDDELLLDDELELVDDDVLEEELLDDELPESLGRLGSLSEQAAMVSAAPSRHTAFKAWGSGRAVKVRSIFALHWYDSIGNSSVAQQRVRHCAGYRRPYIRGKAAPSNIAVTPIEFR